MTRFDAATNDWLGAALRRFDLRWMPAGSGLTVDEAGRSGLIRISADDADARLAWIITFYRAERDGLLRFARSLLGRRHEDAAEDLLQEVMRKICANPPELRKAGNESAYFHRALRNAATTIGTRATREQQRRTDDPEAADRLCDPHAAFEDPILFQLTLTRALARLSPQMRVVVELVDIKGFTVKDAANELGIAVGTAQNYRFVALGRLRGDPGLDGMRPVA